MTQHKRFTLAALALAMAAMLAAGGAMGAPAKNQKAKKEAPHIQVGQTAPEFTLPNQDDKPVKLSDYRGQWVVLYFYPKDFTSGCTTEACSFRDGIESFEKVKATVLGVSPDQPAQHRKFIKAYHLPFTLLSDPSMKVMLRYGGAVRAKKDGKVHNRVVRSTVLIDPEGKIAWHWPHVKPAGHAEEVAKKLAELRQ